MLTGRKLITLVAAIAGFALAGTAVAQEAPKSIKVGYAISMSGPQAGGAMLTNVPNYRLWVSDVNKAGGIMLKKYGKRVPIEVTEIDDRSNNEDMVRMVERLMTVDKVDLVLSPWGTGPNLQAAPTFHKHGYPQIMGTAGHNDIEKMVERFPTMFWMLGKPSEQVAALVKMLSDLKGSGQINDSVAMFTVQHPFGQDYLSAAKPLLAAAGFKINYETSYPLGVSDLSAQIRAASAAKADTMLAWSYPPDTFMLTEQSLAAGFTPKIRLVGVGGAMPIYRAKFGDKINGIFSLGGWNPDGPGMQDYIARHKEVNKGAEPDRWASAKTYAGLEALQQAIERVGEIDRAAIIKELQTGTFKTLIGEIQLKGNRNPNIWQIGQWQDGEFYGVAPPDMPGARKPKLP
jgi:branched-chain amino acid transport system substrate-binding protein